MEDTNLRKCGKCQLYKLEDTNNFRVRKYKNGMLYFHSICRDCERSESRKYAEEHREERKEYSKNFSIKNPEYKKNWKLKNKGKLNKQERDKRQSDINFRLKKIISRSINKVCYKYGNSIIKYLPYTIQELRRHLENQFDPWMNWQNHGSYNRKLWDDNDPTTWTWQIDHIMPHSIFNYTSMNDFTFQECWALENLRPYSAKQNIIDGATRIRHKKV